jgi:hypothetical protein
MKRAELHVAPLVAVACALLVATGAGAQGPGDRPTVEQCGAAFENAQVLRRDARLRDATSELRVCGSNACPPEITERCVGWLAEVEAAIPSVVIAAKDAAGRDTLDVRVLRNGEVLAERLDVRALPIDPGTHKLRFELDGSPAVEISVVLREGQKNERVEVRFRPPAPASARAPAPNRRAVGRAPTAAPDRESGSISPLAYVGFALGGAGLVLGIAAGAIALEEYGDLEDKCGGPTGCTLQEIDDAEVVAHVSTAGFVVAGVGAAGGLIALLLTLPDKSATSVRPVVGPMGLGIAGSF